MKVPYFNWIPFDKNNPPSDIYFDNRYLILLREDNYDNGATWTYSVDIAVPHGSYISNFWDTENDWQEGQRVEVVAYAKIPEYFKESDMVEQITYKEK